jgi:hypothetical protein
MWGLVICTETLVYHYDGSILLEKGRFYDFDESSRSILFSWSDKNNPKVCPPGRCSSSWFAHNPMEGDIGSDEVMGHFMKIEDWRNKQIKECLNF